MSGITWRFQGERYFAPCRTDQFLIIDPYTHINAPDDSYDLEGEGEGA